MTDKNDFKKLGHNGSRNWSTLNLSDWLLHAIKCQGFESMTPVQANTIPLFMGNKDVVVEAVTGSGKTLAYLVPLIERILRIKEPVQRHNVIAAIVAPTVELASQIHTVLLSLLEFHEPSAHAINKIFTTFTEYNSQTSTSPTFHVDPYQNFTTHDDPYTDESTFVPVVMPQLVVGGASVTVADDLRRFTENSPNLLIGTPGRLARLLASHHVHTRQHIFDALVLDEADRLLDLGFKEDLQKILTILPKQRRTGLFSASVTEAVGNIVRTGLRNPVKITVKVKCTNSNQVLKTPSSLTLTHLIVKADRRFASAVKLITQVIKPQPWKSIVFLSTCAAVDYFSHIFPALFRYFNGTREIYTCKVKSDIIPQLFVLHGKLASNMRSRNYARFIACVSPCVLLTTDVAARGLDVQEVDFVVQIDPPVDAKAYLHRAGRAGRAGRSGIATIFLSPGREEEYIEFLKVRGMPAKHLRCIVNDEQDLYMSDNEALDTVNVMRQCNLLDQKVYEKGQRGFVSWVRAYRQHDVSGIFRIEDIEWTKHARGWGLLELPCMPEVKKLGNDERIIELPEEAKMRLNEYKLNKRSKQLNKVGPAKRRENCVQTVRWSHSKEVKKERKKKQEMQKRRRELTRESRQSQAERLEREELQSLIEKVSPSFTDVKS